ncbi:MAG: hypothetical protein WBV82_25380 [Myxococcaceae bacterium]
MRTVWVLALSLVPLGAGCFEPPKEAEARLEALKQQGRDLDAAMDDIEERLLGSRATVSLWKEMAWRHQKVSAIACENVAGHAEQIEKYFAEQEEKGRKVRRQRRRYQANAPVSSTATSQGRKARSNERPGQVQTDPLQW